MEAEKKERSEKYMSTTGGMFIAGGIEFASGIAVELSTSDRKIKAVAHAIKCGTIVKV